MSLPQLYWMSDIITLFKRHKVSLQADSLFARRYRHAHGSGPPSSLIICVPNHKRRVANIMRRLVIVGVEWSRIAHDFRPIWTGCNGTVPFLISSSSLSDILFCRSNWALPKQYVVKFRHRSKYLVHLLRFLLIPVWIGPATYTRFVHRDFCTSWLLVTRKICHCSLWIKYFICFLWKVLRKKITGCRLVKTVRKYKIINF